ncbi:NUDIX domain-containing protein [Parafrankia irregularis]|uniref:NUDIX domain-containing protein n=2 Tax=Frankiaceae TaxID=74712 RepID=A0A0S4R0V1_9ACTN|nr:NUDIX hydrolase [Parafrankia sp. CH37]CUU60990.1 NUDIX domain-containing protein [Parafrankia irregularis]
MVPAHLLVTQVYGWLIDDAGRVLVQDIDGWHNLPGGTPESCDRGLVDTLVREAREESQVEVVNPVYLGFQEVRRPGRAPYAQVRMTARISRFDARRPDPDGGQIYQRLMTSLACAPGLLGWGQPAVEQALEVQRVAATWWRLPVTAPSAAAVYVP